MQYEIKRQKRILFSAEVCGDRRWDDISGKKLPHESKEDAQDYRFSPPRPAALIFGRRLYKRNKGKAARASRARKREV